MPEVAERMIDLGSSEIEWKESEGIFGGRLREGTQTWAAAVAVIPVVSSGGTGGVVVVVPVVTAAAVVEIEFVDSPGCDRVLVVPMVRLDVTGVSATAFTASSEAATTDGGAGFAPIAADFTDSSDSSEGGSSRYGVKLQYPYGFY